MAGAFPLPIAAREISDWLNVYPPALPRAEVDEVLFALDAAAMADDDNPDDLD